VSIINKSLYDIVRDEIRSSTLSVILTYSYDLNTHISLKEETETHAYTIIYTHKDLPQNTSDVKNLDQAEIRNYPGYLLVKSSSFEGPLCHGKGYLFIKERSPPSISAVVTSANFTEDGLKENIEFFAKASIEFPDDLSDYVSIIKDAILRGSGYEFLSLRTTLDESHLRFKDDYHVIMPLIELILSIRDPLLVQTPNPYSNFPSKHVNVYATFNIPRKPDIYYSLRSILEDIAKVDAEYVEVFIVSPFITLKGVECLARLMRDKLKDKGVSIKFLIGYDLLDSLGACYGSEIEELLARYSITFNRYKDIRFWIKSKNIARIEGKEVKGVLHAKAIVVSCNDKCYAIIRSPNITEHAQGLRVDTNFELAAVLRGEYAIRLRDTIITRLWNEATPFYDELEERIRPCFIGVSGGIGVFKEKKLLISKVDNGEVRSGTEITPEMFEKLYIKLEPTTGVVRGVRQIVYRMQGNIEEYTLEERGTSLFKVKPIEAPGVVDFIADIEFPCHKTCEYLVFNKPLYVVKERREITCEYCRVLHVLVLLKISISNEEKSSELANVDHLGIPYVILRSRTGKYRYIDPLVDDKLLMYMVRTTEDSIIYVLPLKLPEDSNVEEALFYYEDWLCRSSPHESIKVHEHYYPHDAIKTITKYLNEYQSINGKCEYIRERLKNKVYDSAHIMIYLNIPNDITFDEAFLLVLRSGRTFCIPSSVVDRRLIFDLHSENHDMFKSESSISMLLILTRRINEKTKLIYVLRLVDKVKVRSVKGETERLLRSLRIPKNTLYNV